jgi:hypothetical protein
MARAQLAPDTDMRVDKNMRIGKQQVIKVLNDSVKIYEISYRDADPVYGVEINGVSNTILHLDYMTAYEEAREAVK